MKKIILILCLAAISCRKEKIEPAQPAKETETVLLNYRVTGFKDQGTETITCAEHVIRGVAVLDSCAVYLNGSLISEHAYSYHMQAKKGDVITFYIQSPVSDSQNCNFAIWPDRNEQPHITYFKPNNGIIIGTYVIY